MYQLISFAADSTRILAAMELVCYDRRAVHVQLEAYIRDRE